MARALVQALSNLATANEMLLSEVWETYLNLPEERAVILCEHQFIHLVCVTQCFYPRVDGSWDPLILTLFFWFLYL